MDRRDGPETSSRNGDTSSIPSSAPETRLSRGIEDGGGIDRYLLPQWIRTRFVSLEITTPRSTYPIGSSVPFSIRIRNAAPIAVTIRTQTPQLWTWSIGGVRGGSRLSRESPEKPREFTFERRSRVRYRRRWNGSFRIARREWEPAEPGTYSVAAELNVGSSSSRLRDETTIRLVSE